MVKARYHGSTVRLPAAQDSTPRARLPCALEQLNALVVNAAAPPPPSIAEALGCWGRS